MTTIETSTPTREEQVAVFIQGLRDLADFLDGHPDAVPSIGGVTVERWAWSADELAERVRTLGAGEKFEEYGTIGLRLKFGPHKVQTRALQTDTCEKKPTGKITTITREVDPAKEELPTGARNLRSRTVITFDFEEPEYEWDCAPLLAGSKPDLHLVESPDDAETPVEDLSPDDQEPDLNYPHGRGEDDDTY